ncbi:MAG: DUF4421 domain-containing protein [Bacteroides sp.]|nr:DUF4421 domain-containing protein [Bacteroides sp.]
MKSHLLLIVFCLISIFQSAAGNNIPEADLAVYYPLDLNVTATIPTDEQIKPLVRSREDRWWWNLLKKGKLNMADTSVIYPKFIKFCVDVYNWGDRTFNSYDTDYVVGTGKRWKARIVNENWVDNYLMTLPLGLKTDMLSNLYSNIGAYLQYMAVSYGYTYDMANIVGGSSTDHKKWEFGFNCARFNVEMYYQENTGGTYLRKFGKYRKGHLFKEFFPGVNLHNFGVEAYYFFNNRRYSQGAAYNFSKIQKKSQGSFIIGANYTNQKIRFDFSQLPEDMLPFLTIPAQSYLFHYKSYSMILGYGFNWVINPKLLFNISAMPSFGASHCYEDSLEGERWMFAFNLSARSSLTYNLGNYFIGLIGKMNGHLYRSGTYALFSAVENFSANIGIRF